MIEITPDSHFFSIWLIKYGSVALFFLLALGIFALPIPEETLMVASGILMHQGKLPIPPTLFFALAGSITGITLSYVLGRSAGKYLVLKWGKKIGLREESIQKAHRWFERFGKWLLLIGYFIPGIRHFTGFSAGVSQLEFRYFALFAYTGALLWVTLFISLGYYLGKYWFALFHKFQHLDFVIILLLALVCLAGAFFAFQKWKKRK